MFDPIPEHHPRLMVWANAMRRSGVTAKYIAWLFNVELGVLIEAGMEP
ncbi:hypothetical protein ACETKC_10250 [Brevundimonas intermedia]|nr:hypothetical protein [Brevundimonas intermedia]